MILPEAIISDADGTLVDTLHLIRHGHFETSKAYLSQLGLADNELPSYETYEEALHQSIGGSARHTLEQTIRLLYRDRPDVLNRVDYAKLHDLLDPIQDHIAPKFVRAYDGLSDFLTTLGDLNIQFAIFTSGTPYHIVRNFGVSMPDLGLADLYNDKSISDTKKLQQFENTLKARYGIPGFTVVTCDDVPTHKPNPASLLLAISRLGAKPATSAVLGDHTVDMEAGIRANVAERIGITHGFNDIQTLREAGATSVVDSLAQLASLLKQA